MAKATAQCKCKICGDSFIRTSICHNRKQADSWEEWAIDNFDLCPKCFAKQQNDIEKEKGLYVDIRLNSQSAYLENTYPIAIIFGGDTMPHKDTIKTLHARYTDDYPADGMLGDLLMTRSPKLRWVLYCKIEDIQTKIDQVKGIGAKINSFPSETDLALYMQVLNNAQKERAKKEKEKQEAMQAELETIGKIPSWPKDILKMWPDGAKWNGKFYGKSGRWSVYFSGEKVELTDVQKEAMEKAQEERQKWREKKSIIDNKFK